MPFFVRHIDGDLLCFVHEGKGLVETEFGPLRYRQGDWLYLPKACTWRHVPDDQCTWLMICLMLLPMSGSMIISMRGSVRNLSITASW